MLNIIVLVLSLVLSVICCIFSPLLNNWWDLYIPILLFVAFFVGILIIFFLTLYIISLFFNQKKPVKTPSRFCIVMFNLVNEFLIFWSGAKVQVFGKEKIDKNQQYLFVLNHNSNFDTMILSNIFKKQDIIYLSKPSNLKIPIAGNFVYKYGYLSINRDDNREAISTITKAVSRIKDNHMSVGVCPEGTRNKTKSQLLPFKAGCFKIAKLSNVPIAIVCLKNTRNIHKNFPFGRTKVQVHIVDIIERDVVQSMSTIELSNIAHEKIENELNKG